MRLSDNNNTLIIPYRESKLTRVLKSSLKSNTKVVIICNISPSSEALEETISTLEFAKRAKKVKQIVAKNETTGIQMIIVKYENEINELQHKLRDMEQKAIIGNESVGLKQEIGVMKKQLNKEMAEKARLSEAFEKAMADRAQLEAEIAKLQSRILVSENLIVEPVEPLLGKATPLDRRIMRLTITRNPLEPEEGIHNDKFWTSSIAGLNQADFCKKTMDAPEEAMKFHKALIQLDLRSNDFNPRFSIRDTMLLDKIDNLDDLFGDFNPRNSRLTNNSSIRDSVIIFNTPQAKEEDKNMPSREQLLEIISEQDKIIVSLRVDVQEKADNIEVLKDELQLYKDNMKALYQQIKNMKQIDQENKK